MSPAPNDLDPRFAAALAWDAPARRRLLDQLAAQPRADALARVDGDLADVLVASLASERRSEQRHAAEVIARLAPDSAALLAALRRALGDASARLRWGAAYTLGHALPPGPELWPAARETLELDDGDQRWAAAELACAIARAHPSVLVEIRQELGASSATLRKMCLYCLRDLGEADAPRWARALLDDGDAGVRLAALATVARATPASEDARAAAERLAAMLPDDPDLGVRRAAAATLGKLGAASITVLAALRTAAAASDASLARAALGALRTLGASG